MLERLAGRSQCPNISVSSSDYLCFNTHDCGAPSVMKVSKIASRVSHKARIFHFILFHLFSSSAIRISYSIFELTRPFQSTFPAIFPEKIKKIE